MNGQANDSDGAVGLRRCRRCAEGVRMPSETKDTHTHRHSTFSLCLCLCLPLHSSISVRRLLSTGTALAECEKRTGTPQWPSRLHRHHRVETDITYRERETQNKIRLEMRRVASVESFNRSLVQDGHECMRMDTHASRDTAAVEKREKRVHVRGIDNRKLRT